MRNFVIWGVYIIFCEMQKDGLGAYRTVFQIWGGIGLLLGALGTCVRGIMPCAVATAISHAALCCIKIVFKRKKYYKDPIRQSSRANFLVAE